MCELVKKSDGLSSSASGDTVYCSHWRELKGCNDNYAPRKSPLNTVLQLAPQSGANQAFHRQSSLKHLKGDPIRYRNRVIEFAASTFKKIWTVSGELS
jgi:hypothetical protein